MKVYRLILVLLILNLGVAAAQQTNSVSDGIDSKTFAELKARAENGDAHWQYVLGGCYAQGIGVTQDDAEGVKWYRKAAEQNDVDAQYSLGWCYHDGHGVAQDYAETVKWWHKAAEQGNMIAQYNLGCCYRDGQGVAQDDVEAAKCGIGDPQTKGI